MNTMQRILLAAGLFIHQKPISRHKELDKKIEEQDTMRTQYDHQPSYPSIGKENQILMDALTKAKNVAINLARAGHRVLDINIGTRNARLTISASSRCHMLGGAMIKLIRMNGAEEKTMAANIDGVQVEWTTSTRIESGQFEKR